MKSQRKRLKIEFISRDRFRTVVNVLGDSFGAGIIEHFSREELKRSAITLENGHANGNLNGDIKIAPVLQTPTATLTIDDTRM